MTLESDDLPQSLISVLRALDDCIERKQALPALILLYSTIDFLASLEHPTSTRGVFMRWVNEYMVRSNSLSCTGVDLYAARCGVLHNFSTVSDLQRSGKARELLYAWGTANATDLQQAADLVGKNILAVHVRDLRDALHKGVSRFFEEVSQYPLRQKNVKQSVGKSLVNMDKSFLDMIMRLSRS